MRFIPGKALLLALLTLLLVGTQQASAQVRYKPDRKILYESLTPSTALTGATTAETALTAATGRGSQTLTAARLTVGSTIYFDDTYLFTCNNSGSGAAETLDIKGYIGGITGQLIYDTGALALAAASVTDSVLRVHGYIEVVEGGATGKGKAVATLSYTIGAGTPVCKTQRTYWTSYDWTASKVRAMSADWGGTTESGDTMTLDSVRTEWGNTR